jgi:hypothetical protein
LTTEDKSGRVELFICHVPGGAGDQCKDADSPQMHYLGGADTTSGFSTTVGGVKALRIAKGDAVRLQAIVRRSGGAILFIGGEIDVRLLLAAMEKSKL